MKKKLWVLGIGFTILLCGLQLMVWAGNRAGGEKFTIESNAANRVNRYAVRKRFHYYSTKMKQYVTDYEETEIFYVDEGTVINLDLQTREGYAFNKMVINSTLTMYDCSSLMILRNTDIDFYFDPQSSFRQIYRYYLYDPVKDDYAFMKTEIDDVPSGRKYVTRIQFTTEKYHVEKIYFNNSVYSQKTNFSYVVNRSNCIDVYLYPSRTFLQYYDDAGNLVGSQTILYGEKKKLLAHSLEKPGYEFAGWKATINGVVQMFQDQEEFETPFTEDLITLKLIAAWEPIQYHIFLRYHSNEEKQGVVYSGGQYEWEDTIVLWNLKDHPNPVENASLIGWSLRPDQQQVEYSPGQELRTETLYERAKELGLVESEEREPIVDLYPVWDKSPQIKTTHVYITQKEALSGKVTPAFLYQKLEAKDPEEGRLELLTDNGFNTSGVWFSNYQASMFQLGRSGDVTLFVEARDSAGNVAEEQMVCTIVESEGTYLGKTKRVRFISEEYLDTLKEDSVWNRDEQYRKLLKEVLEKARCA